MARKNILIGAAVVGAGLALAVAAGLQVHDAAAQQDSVTAGQIDNPSTFRPGYASDAGRSDHSEYSENSGKLQGKTMDQIGNELSKQSCGYRNGVKYVHGMEYTTSTCLDSRQSCSGYAEKDVTCTSNCVKRRHRFYFCDGQDFVLVGENIESYY